MDDVYCHVSKCDKPISVESEHTRATSAWAAFVDPNITLQLAIDPSSGSLHDRTGNAPPKDLISVPKISVDEHRAIATSFLPKIPAAIRHPFEEALNQKIFWPSWMSAFKRLGDQAVFTNWMTWRYDSIISLFEDKLKALNLAVPVISTALAELKSSKPSKSSSVAPPKPTSHYPDTQLRALAHSTLDSMDDRDLGRIWLPLGAIADALRRIS